MGESISEQFYGSIVAGEQMSESSAILEGDVPETISESFAACEGDVGETMSELSSFS